MEGLLSTDAHETKQTMKVPTELLEDFQACQKLCGPAFNIGIISLNRFMEVMWAPFLKLAAKIHQVTHKTPASKIYL